MNRRKFLRLAAHGALGTAVSTAQLYAGIGRPIKAIAFDAFPIFDPRPIFGLVKQLYPKKGRAFSILWRTRIFEYTWLRTSAGVYQDFWSCIDDALVYTARELQLSLSSSNRQKLMQAFLSIKSYSDVSPVLSRLRASGVKLAFLSNMSEGMLNAGIVNSGLQGYFDHILSTDRVKTFKPDPRAYQMAVDTFSLEKDEIAFAAYASWDAVGARWFGYPTVWVNRLNFQEEVLGTQANRTGTDLSVVEDFVISTHITGKLRA